MAWQPRMLPHGQHAPALLSPSAIQREMQNRITGLTAEIDHWLPEFGEQALLALYENRAHLADILQGML